MIIDEYYSVSRECIRTMKIDSSRFIASVFPARNRPEAEELLHRVKKEYFDAAHNCFAFTFGPVREEFKYSDDGEPSGTAGIKILSAIVAAELSDAIVVVTRYFGGVKLGVGGLGRAYHESALEACRSAGRKTKRVMQSFSLNFPYEQTNPVMNLISSAGAKIIKSEYGTTTVLLAAIRLREAESFSKEYVEATSGRAKISPQEILTMDRV